jgi:hypothetical protein
MPKVLNLREKQKPQAPKSAPIKNLNKSAALEVIKNAFPPKNNLPTQMSWDAPSFYFNPQKKYLAMTVIALVLGGGSLLFFNGEKLTAIFLLLSSLVLILYSTRRPEMSKVVIDPRGILINDVFYFYKDFRSFWIHYYPGHLKELSLESKRWYMPYVKVSIENKNPIAIRSLLINFLPEKEHEHSLVDIIARKIGL